MVPSKYDRNVYGVTPPRESNEDDTHSPTENNNNKLPTTFNPDPKNVSDVATLLKARLQYAQIKIATGMSTENLQQIECAFISSPRQPRRPLPSEYPPIQAHLSPHSRKLKRLLLSAITPTQNSWRKKKRIREQKKNEAIEEEAAARTILMLSSLSKTLLTPPRSVPSGGSMSSSDDHGNKEPVPSIYDAVSVIPDYEEKSKCIAQSLSRRKVQQFIATSDEEMSPTTIQKQQHKPPPTVVSHTNKYNGSPHQYYQYNRPPPPPPQYYYRPGPLPMYGRPLPEDPFYSTTIMKNNISASRHSSRSPPSPPQ